MASNTTGNLIREGYGLNLHCKCGRHAAMSTADMRKLPQDLSVPDLLARLKCKKCGRQGMAEARLDVESAPFSPSFGRLRGTPPQLWAR